MKIRLTRRLSLMLNGLDLSQVQKGDALDLPAPEAEMLVAEGWAIPISERDQAHDRPKRARKQRRSSAKKR